jgi:pSer/pThr/pTyr-binding forkhead associated (FHA) protein
MVGVSPAGVVPFTPEEPEDPRNTRLGIVRAGVVPFTPEEATDPRNTRLGIPPAAAVPFKPQADEPAEPPTIMSAPAETVILPARKERPITGVRLITADGVFEAGTGQSTIGRGVQAAIRIPDKQISRIHALIDVTPLSVTVEDQESVNGTKVNGTRIEGRQVLAEGDVVMLGDIELRVDFIRLGGN